MSYRLLKNLLDSVIAAFVLIFLSPILLFTACSILLQSGRPILFRQQRPGLHGRPFTIYKFRTMTNSYDSKGNLLPDEQRLSILGKFLRSTSIDELPALINVLKKEMSLVGPRPLLMRYLERYTPEQAKRHEVKPGITGWAQIKGRNTLSWEEKFKLDVWYVDNRSIRLDIKIIFMTVAKVFRREGISADGEATMKEFMGHKESHINDK